LFYIQQFGFLPELFFFRMLFQICIKFFLD